MIDALDKSVWCCQFCRFYDPLPKSSVCSVESRQEIKVDENHCCEKFEWFAYSLWKKQKEAASE